MATKLLKFWGRRKANTQIYILDDDPITVSIFSSYLQKALPEKLPGENFTFTEFEGPSPEFLQKIQQEKPQILILDYHIETEPGKEVKGSQVLKKVQESSPNTDVLMLTGEDNLEIAVSMLKSGAYDYIIKGDTATVNTLRAIMNLINLRNLKQNKSQKRIMVNLLITGWVVLLGAGIAASVIFGTGPH